MYKFQHSAQPLRGNNVRQQGGRNTEPGSAMDLTTYPITVLLVDDQAMIGEAVRRMLAEEDDIGFHYCSEPTQAIQKATEIAPTVILLDLVRAC